MAQNFPDLSQTFPLTLSHMKHVNVNITNIHTDMDRTTSMAMVLKLLPFCDLSLENTKAVIKGSLTTQFIKL